MYKTKGSLAASGRVGPFYIWLTHERNYLLELRAIRKGLQKDEVL